VVAKKTSCGVTRRKPPSTSLLNPSPPQYFDTNHSSRIDRASHNPRVSEQAREHAQQEADKLSNYGSDEERHEENVKRGLKAYVHQPSQAEKLVFREKIPKQNVY
jgi:hypothetical protein